MKAEQTPPCTTFASPGLAFHWRTRACAFAQLLLYQKNPQIEVLLYDSSSNKTLLSARWLGMQAPSIPLSALLLKLFVLARIKSKAVIFGRAGGVISAVQAWLALRVNPDCPTLFFHFRKLTGLWPRYQSGKMSWIFVSFRFKTYLLLWLTFYGIYAEKWFISPFASSREAATLLSLVLCVWYMYQYK